MKSNDWLICLLLFSLLSCKELEEHYILEGEAFTARVGHLYHTPKNSFWITAVSDSRCPQGATCFMAGNAKVYFRFYQPQLRDTSLNLYGHQFENPVIVLDSLSFKLKSVTPGPSIHKQVKQKDYRIEMTISRQ